MWDKRQEMWEYENIGKKEKRGGCFKGVTERQKKLTRGTKGRKPPGNLRF